MSFKALYEFMVLGDKVHHQIKNDKNRRIRIESNDHTFIVIFDSKYYIIAMSLYGGEGWTPRDPIFQTQNHNTALFKIQEILL